jgi:hypothetical protein
LWNYKWSPIERLGRTTNIFAAPVAHDSALDHPPVDLSERSCMFEDEAIRSCLGLESDKIDWMNRNVTSQSF